MTKMNHKLNPSCSRKGAVFCILGLLASTQTAVAAQFLCSFDETCTVLTQSEECTETNEMIFVRTPPHADFRSFIPDPDIQNFIGDTNVFGTPGILPGESVPASLRQSFPDGFRRTAVRLNMTKRTREATADDDDRLKVIAYSNVVNNTGALTQPKMVLSIHNDFDATFVVGADQWRDLIYHGTCEEFE